ncbi:APC family permease [Sinomonas sp. ASV322]|uniref:APC family permease n=1 Tax=Sinomonas sp. ASV322 TaxID=3041920 RepID=UPI0027DCCCD8|nr:APC family permease [Sinomonas sp. ASV322]MDQ4504383.1 APC family permease [Sinomonas sp. ASV322]
MAFTKEAPATSPAAATAPGGSPSSSEAARRNQQGGHQPGLKRDAIGTRDIVFMLVSAAAPLTIVVGIAPLALAVGGVGAPAIYVVAALGLGLFALGFMALTRHVLSYSGFYGYIVKTLGRVVGLGSGLTAWLSYNGLQIGLYGLLGIQANLCVKSFTGVELPWWLYAVAAVGAVWFLGWRGIDVGARVVAILLTLETAIVVIVAVAVLAQGGAHGIGFESFSPHVVFSPAFAAVLGLGFSAFMGFESGALYREEARNPDRTVPRATYISIAFIGAFYAFAVWIIVQAFGPAAIQDFAAGHLDAGDTAYVMAGQFAGPWCVQAMSVLIVTSIFAAQLSFHNTINRYTLSLGREGIFPAWTAKVSPRFFTPSNAGTLQTVLSLAFVGAAAALQLDPFTQFLIWMNTPGVFGVLALQGLTSVGVVVFFVRRRDLRPAWHVVPSAIAAALVMAAVSGLTIANINLLTGAPVGDPLNTVLIVVAPAVFVGGAVVALRLRRRRPLAYARIGNPA